MKYSSRQISENKYAIVIIYFRSFMKPQGGYPVGNIAKRLTDVALARVGFVLLAQHIIGHALVVASTSTGRVQFWNNRIGSRGRNFKRWKYRLMLSNGNAVLQHQLPKSFKKKTAWEVPQKLKHARRMTTVGRSLRKLCLMLCRQLMPIAELRKGCDTWVTT